MARYDTIGKTYNTTRKADPWIAEKIKELLAPAPGAPCLDIGCGTGNYLNALHQRGINITGIDPSETMLRQARDKYPDAKLVQGTAEQLPFDDASMGGAVSVLSLHHWDQPQQGLMEICRVLQPGARLVMFTFTPDQVKGYWLCHYFPNMMERCIYLTPERDTFVKMLHTAGFREVMQENYFIREGLEDHFMYSNKFHPEQYLLPEIRNNTSGFTVFADPAEVEAGLVRLEDDIRSGRIHEVIQSYLNERGDYLFLVATK